MTAFEYSALDAGGKQRRGVLEGDTARHVRQQIRERGWIPVAVDEVRERRRGGGRRARVSVADVTLLTRQLATLIGAGLPLEEALRAAGAQTERAGLRALVAGVRASVVEGNSLADGLGRFPGAFPELYRATVAAGEHTGRLDVVLERLADYTEQRQQLRGKVQQALAYPAALIVISLAVVTLLLAYVVPKVTRVFEDMDQRLPALTQGLIAVSDFLRINGIWLALAAAGALAACAWFWRRQGFRRRVDLVLLRLPLAGRLVRGLNAARFARTFSILLGSGVAVLEALRIAAGVIANRPMRAAVIEAAGRVREGSAIAPALESSGQFPPMMVHLAASGEGSGRLEHMLERAAVSQEREVERTIGMLLALFEPALIVAMGGVVLVIVLAILLPIFELNQLVR
ncbi:MAG: type II secretion system inner membrane protein GspF [Nitrococcus sp.]|nr:type II secretion system inner membrane protein GspF [Nitrococcus sp.]